MVYIENVYSVVPLSLSQKHLHSNGIPLFDTQNVINKLKHEADFHDEEAKALTVVMHELMKKKYWFHTFLQTNSDWFIGCH